MKENDEEVEIKIEYFDKFEIDPLSDFEESVKMKDSNTPQSRTEVKIQEDILESHNHGYDDSNHENDDSILSEPAIVVNWHKHIDEYGKYVCRFCDLSYCTVQTLRHHVRTKHVQNYINIKNIPIMLKRHIKVKCHICKMTFENTNVLQEHSITHSLNKTQNSCLLCLATFKGHNDLLNHMANKHETFKKVHICTICGYSTPKVSNFKKHLDLHTGRNKRKCAFCEYTTNSHSNMKIHEQIHSNEKPYKCAIEGCEYSCKTVSALRSHRLMHNKEKHMMYCDKCSYSTVYKINLKKHIDTHQRRKLADENNDLGIP